MPVGFILEMLSSDEEVLNFGPYERSGNHSRHPAVLRRDEHIDGAGHVRLVRGEGILHRPGHGGDGRLVKNAIRAGEGLR